MVNGDIWWHLRTGEYILETGSIPRANLFSYTNPDSTWIDLHWLFQIAMAVTYEQFGTTGLVLFKSLIGGAVFGLLFLTVRQRLPGILLAICWLPFVWIYAGRYHVRPEMFSHFYLAFTLYILHRHSVGDRQWIWLLIPLQIAWVNSQGLFILELCVLGAYSIDVQCCAKNRNKINSIWAMVLLCLVASLINPYGLEGALFPLELLGKVGGDQRAFFQLLAGETQGTPGLAKAIYGGKTRKVVTGDAHGIAHVTRMLKSLHEDPLTPKLASIRCPVLLLVGEKDPMGPRASEIVHDAMSAGRAKLLRLPDKGHWLQLEAVEPVVAALDVWLEEFGL